MERLRPTPRLADSTRWTAQEVMQALNSHYLWECTSTASFPELELHPHIDDNKCFRRADLLTVFNYGVCDSYKFAKDRQQLYRPYDSYPLRRLPNGWRTGFEIKVTRADLLCDLKQEHKQSGLAKVCNETYLVHPRGMWKQKPHPSPHCPGQFIDEFTLPHGMGRIEVYHDPRPRWFGALRAKIVKLPSYNMQPETPPWLLANMLLHNRPQYTQPQQPNVVATGTPS